MKRPKERKDHRIVSVFDEEGNESYIYAKDDAVGTGIIVSFMEYFDRKAKEVEACEDEGEIEAFHEDMQQVKFYCKEKLGI